MLLIFILLTYSVLINFAFLILLEYKNKCVKNLENMLEEITKEKEEKEMVNVEKMTTEEMTEAVNAEEAMNTIQKGIINELADIECDMLRCYSDTRYFDLALKKIQRLKKELIADAN